MLDGSETDSRIEDAEEVEKAAGRNVKIRVIPEGSPWNEVELAMLQRRSIRKFRKAQVPAHLIRRMLEMGRFAPSQGNCQPWKFVVIRDAKIIQGMEDFCVAACKKLSDGFDYTTQPVGSLQRTLTYAKVNLFSRLQPNMLHPVPMTVATSIAKGRFAVFHRAPTVILLLMDKRGVGVPPIDIGICGTNIVLAAQSYGVGTCWVGFSKLLGESPEWRERLGVEDPYEISEAISVGYPVGDPTHLISRETHEIAWFEGGKKELLF
ncbi:MAG: nitroreductase family protein [Candidatus Binatia bacterium]